METFVINGPLAEVLIKGGTIIDVKKDYLDFPHVLVRFPKGIQDTNDLGQQLEVKFGYFYVPDWRDDKAFFQSNLFFDCTSTYATKRFRKEVIDCSHHQKIQKKSSK